MRKDIDQNQQKFQVDYSNLKYKSFVLRLPETSATISYDFGAEYMIYVVDYIYNKKRSEKNRDKIIGTRTGIVWWDDHQNYSKRVPIELNHFSIEHTFFKYD